MGSSPALIICKRSVAKETQGLERDTRPDDYTAHVVLCYLWYIALPFASLQLMEPPEPPTVGDILAHCGVTESQLDKPCSNVDIADIASFFGSWRDVAPHLGLDETNVEEVEEDGRKGAERRLKALQKWKSKFGFKATYKWLVEALMKVNLADRAEKVCQLVKSQYRKWICRW